MASVARAKQRPGPTQAARDFALQRAVAKRQAQVRNARERCEDFIEYAIPHEQTGKPVKNAPFHVEWQELLRESPYVVIIAPIEHCKTQQIAVAKMIHLLGNNPEGRFAIISNTAAQAEKILKAVRQHIETNPRVHEVFPWLRRSTRPSDPWGQSQITVERKTIAKDSSVQAVGVYGPLVGSRLDGIIGDDLLDFENTRTADQLAKLLDWFDTTVWTRLTRDDKTGFRAPCYIIGTPWNENDLLHVLSKRPAWVSRTYCAVENPEDKPAEWRPIWFSKERLVEVWQNILPHNFWRKYFCRISSDALSRFRKAWINKCVALGARRTLLDRAPVAPSGREYPCFTGIDLGVGQDEHHDLSVIFTIAVIERNRRLLVNIQSGRWQGPEIVSRIYETQRRFNSICRCEDNAAQKFILQFAHADGIPVLPFTTTGQNKWSEAFGVESLAVEFRLGLWVIPSHAAGTVESCDEETRQWLRECQFYSPSSHTGDRLIASWIARETAREFGQGISSSMDTLAR